MFFYQTYVIFRLKRYEASADRSKTVFLAVFFGANRAIGLWALALSTYQVTKYVYHCCGYLLVSKEVMTNEIKKFLKIESLTFFKHEVVCHGSLGSPVKGNSLSHSSLNNFPSSTGPSLDYMSDSGTSYLATNGPMISSWSAPNALSSQLNGWTSGQEP